MPRLRGERGSGRRTMRRTRVGAALSAPMSVAAPGEPTIVDMVKRELKVVYRQLVSKKDRESKVMVFTLGLVIGATLASVLCCVCFMGGGGAAAPPKQKAA